MRKASLTIQRETGMGEVLIFTAEVNLEQSYDGILKTLAPLYKAADERCGYKVKRLLDYQNYYRSLPLEQKTAIDLAVEVLYGEQPFTAIATANENHRQAHAEAVIAEGGDAE